MREIKEFRVAAFRHDEERSVSYRSFKTKDGMLQHLKKVIAETDVDYVSLRVIRGEEM